MKVENEKEAKKDGAEICSLVDVGPCCLCHCAIDYSDRAAFYAADREDDYGVADEKEEPVADEKEAAEAESAANGKEAAETKIKEKEIDKKAAAALHEARADAATKF